MTATNGRVHPDELAAIDPPLRALSLSELAEFTFPKVDEVVDGLIPSGALVLAVGRPKAGKSLIMGIDLCASVALGNRSLTGRRCRDRRQVEPRASQVRAMALVFGVSMDDIAFEAEDRLERKTAA